MPSRHPSGGRRLAVHRLGTTPYSRGLKIQASLVARRRLDEVPDTLLLLEHPHVITMGSGGRGEHVLLDQGELSRLGIERYDVGRGGDVTYHGPGQLVAYPILDLKPDRKDLHRYLRDLERSAVLVAEHFGVRSYTRDGLTGVWTDKGKLAAVGVRVSSGWITSHGVAINVSTEISYFEAIVPCGIPDAKPTSLNRELGRQVPMSEVERVFAASFANVFERSPFNGGQLGKRSAGAAHST